MTVTEQDIRDAINIPEASELSSAVILSAISRATGYITVLREQYTAPAAFFVPCEQAYANYLAYQAYADRVLNVPPGAYSEGQWTPVAEEIVRSTGDKLQGLRQVYEDYEKIIKSYPARPTGTFHSNTSPRPPRFRLGQYDYDCMGMVPPM